MQQTVYASNRKVVCNYQGEANSTTVNVPNVYLMSNKAPKCR